MRLGLFVSAASGLRLSPWPTGSTALPGWSRPGSGLLWWPSCGRWTVGCPTVHSRQKTLGLRVAQTHNERMDPGAPPLTEHNPSPNIGAGTGIEPDTDLIADADRPLAGTRWPGRSDVAVLLVVGVCALALAAFWWWSGKPTQNGPAESGAAPALVVQDRSASQDDPPTDTPRPSAAAPADQRDATAAPLVPGSSAGAATPLSSETVVVDVRGAVRQRGIHSLPNGSRVIDAILAAGGLAKSGTYGDINLAAPLQDGQQLRVGRQNQPNGQSLASGSLPGSDPNQALPAAIPLNSATAAELESLPGVGPVLAQRIAAWRTEHGPFSAVEELMSVSGIGEKVLAGMLDQLTLR